MALRQPIMNTDEVSARERADSSSDDMADRAWGMEKRPPLYEGLPPPFSAISRIATLRLSFTRS